jgi:hypothetical protein
MVTDPQKEVCRMGRKVLGAILLPLPFAALPIIVVVIGAVFGPSNHSEVLVQQTVTTTAPVERVATTDALDSDGTNLAKVSSTSSNRQTVGCDGDEF